jgi:predicted nuclease of predicted toxin-antitoxin system
MTAAPSPRFLIDENLSPTLVDLARERGYEAMAVRDLHSRNRL